MGLSIFLAGFLCATATAGVLRTEVPKLKENVSLDPVAGVERWTETAALPLTWDVAHQRAAVDTTDVHVATDGKYLYVRFDAKQRTPIVISQQSDDLVTGGSTNGGTIAWSDDAVWVDLWPTGAGGFQYQFEANAGGSHNEASTENTAFAPRWESHGVTHDGGYTVTMAIPLGVIHGLHSGEWRAQFIRYVRNTGAQYVWSYDGLQTAADDAARAGVLTMPAATVKAARPAPRVAPYALGSLASGSAGGSTSRMGADVSIPVTRTSAFYSTFHPDYSNVELDQVTIAPTVYQRVFTEVRPFFTQAAQFYNTFSCDLCLDYRTTLYTPGIPTPSQGYAFEGKQGNLGFAAFDAIGTQRNDSAGVVDYTSPDTRWHAAFQHVTADVPGVVDDANEVGLNWNSLKYLNGYFRYANDAGTNVLDSSRASAADAGLGWQSSTFAFFASMKKVGAYFNPVDGFNAHPDIAGYALNAGKVWLFSPNDKLQAVGIEALFDRYQGMQYGQSQSDQIVALDVLTKSAWDFQLYSGSDYWRFGQTLTPVSQNAGFSLMYHSGLQETPGFCCPNHGPSAYPTWLYYNTGRFGDGRLDTWLRNSTIRLGNRGSISLAIDDTAQWLTTVPDNIQWFESAAYSYQLNRNSSFAIGLRRVVGNPPVPNGGGNCMGTCSNISVAYHLRLKTSEIYLAYGDPNTLVTTPQAILKVIFYGGSEKGT
ncbi:MAG: hypothetical protein JO349_01480 [Candidatus Eremiobacteraeota bacterium]|nr:hypothetical protein [Candidatus Eremiobacteraeota bacterium]